MARKAASPSTRKRSARPPRKRSRLESLVPVGAAARARPAAGLSILCASLVAAVFTSWVTFGLGGGRCACGFGLAMVAARCRGGADAVVAMTGRVGVVAVVTCEFVEVVVTLGGGAG